MEREQERLIRLCRSLGAGREQAETMAAQLLKRAGQLAGERGISHSEALSHLLNLVVHGRRGEVFTPARGEKPAENGQNPHGNAD